MSGKKEFGIFFGIMLVSFLGLMIFFNSTGHNIYEIDSGIYGIDGCSEINQSGIYILNESISPSGDVCFNVTSDFVEIDCNNYYIANDSFLGFSIYGYDLEGFNLTNCVFTSSGKIYLQSSDSYIFRNSFSEIDELVFDLSNSFFELNNYDNSDFNLMGDGNLLNQEIYSGDYSLNFSGINNIVVNSTYDLNNELVSGNLVRKWYYRAQVLTNESQNVPYVNITIYLLNSSNNFSSDFVFTEVTDEEGLISSNLLIGYIDNGSINWLDYIGVANNQTYLDNHTFIMNESFLDIFTFYVNYTYENEANSSVENSVTEDEEETNVEEEVQDDRIVSDSANSGAGETVKVTKKETTVKKTSEESDTSIKISSSDLESGFSWAFNDGEEVKFSLEGINYSILLNDFSNIPENETLSFILKPSLEKTNLKIGELTKFDLDSNLIYDISVEFEGISEAFRPKLKINSINERVSANVSEQNASYVPSETERSSYIAGLIKKANSPLFWKVSFLHLMLFVVILAILVAIILIFKKPKSKQLNKNVNNLNSSSSAKSGVKNIKDLDQVLDDLDRLDEE